MKISHYFFDSERTKVANFLWTLANIIDVLHLVVVVPLILLMSALGRHWWARVFIFAVLGSQAALCNCPLTVLTTWMRHFRDPKYKGYSTSVVHWLYAHLGVFANIHWVLAGAAFVAIVAVIGNEFASRKPQVV